MLYDQVLQMRDVIFGYKRNGSAIGGPISYFPVVLV